MIGVVFVAFALGLSNFAAAIGIGLSGVDGRVRVRVAIIFGFFEAVMPLLGLLVGHHVAASIGSAGSYLGGGLLIATGAYALVEARRNRSDHTLALAAIVIAVVSVGMSLVGLEVGGRLGTRIESWSSEIAGVVLMLVGAAIASGIF